MAYMWKCVEIAYVYKYVPTHTCNNVQTTSASCKAPEIVTVSSGFP